MNTTPFKNKKYALLGLGRSGLAAAEMLIESGAEVILWDDTVEGRKTAEEKGFPVKPLDAKALKDCDALIVSPGVPLLYPKPHPVIMEAKTVGVPITGDLDIFFASHPKSTFIGITGTNGKSTTTAMIGNLLKTAGKKACVAGNIGIPVLSLKGDVSEYKVLEVSSYQLDINPMLSCKVAVLLNITPDHLDRHGSFENYVATKKKIFQHQRAQDVAVIGVDDPSCKRIAAEIKEMSHQKVVIFSVENILPQGIYTQSGIIYDATSGHPERIYDCKTHPRMKGTHNWQNMVATYAVGKELNIDVKTIIEAIENFPGLEHRQEYVGSKGKINFVNDSKATNSEAAAKALAAFNNIYWILGGLPKQDGLTATAPYYGKIKHAYIIGEAMKSFPAELEGKLPYTLAETLDTAVNLAYQQAVADGLDNATILLSPACASFDQYKNFELRGTAFKECVLSFLNDRLTVN